MGTQDPKSAHTRGRGGETRAAAFLRLKGYGILERNFRAGAGEIDLIVQRGPVLAFVEVKTRGGKGSPLEAVSPDKVRRLCQAAALYLSSHPLRGRSCRFDVVSVGPDKNWMGQPKIRHFEDAFQAPTGFNV
jgi:putative endonuclease